MRNQIWLVVFTLLQCIKERAREHILHAVSTLLSLKGRNHFLCTHDAETAFLFVYRQTIDSERNIKTVSERCQRK